MERTQLQKPVGAIKINAVILMRVFTDENKQKNDYVSIELPDLFGDEDFVNVGICPKWDNDDTVFKFYARKVLRTTDKIEFPIELRIGSYHSDKKRKDVTYPALFGINPFNSRELEFKVKGKKNAAIFNELARKCLGLSFEDKPDDVETADDDV